MTDILIHVSVVGRFNRAVFFSRRYLVSGLDLVIVVAGDVVCLLFCTFSFEMALFSFSFSLSLSFFSFFFLSSLRKEVTQLTS